MQASSTSQMLSFFPPRKMTCTRHSCTFLCILEWWLHPIFSVPAAGIYVVYTLYICEGSSAADFFLQDSELKWMQTFPNFCNRIFILGSGGISRPDVEDEETRERKYMALFNEWLCVMKLVLNETVSRRLSWCRKVLGDVWKSVDDGCDTTIYNHHGWAHSHSNPEHSSTFVRYGVVVLLPEPTATPVPLTQAKPREQESQGGTSNRRIREPLG